MNYWGLTLFLLPLLAWSQADNAHLAKLRGSLEGRDFGLEKALIDRVLETSQAEAYKDLREAKFYLINGETALARHSLNKLLKAEQGAIRPILFRYSGIAEFQDGQWKKALEQFSRYELNVYPHFARICPLKVVLLIANQDTRNLHNEWSRCKLDNSDSTLQKELVWMDALVALAMKTPFESVAKKAKSFNPLNLSNDDLRVALKLSLYLNIDRNLLESLEKLDYSVVQDEELRSLIAHIYYRNGRLADAWRMMEDVSNPNVENMKGNLWLLRGKPEVAYAQFTLALNLKANSHNAAERALPLAWLLKQWAEGSRLIDRVFTQEKNLQQKLTTAAAFSIANENWAAAFTNLEKVHQKTGEATAHEVSQLSTYVALRQNDAKRLDRYSRQTCANGDLIACWLVSSKFIWPELPALIGQENALEPVEPLWRTLASEQVEAFKEEEFIDQRDIDELDDALIKLVK